MEKNDAIISGVAGEKGTPDSKSTLLHEVLEQEKKEKNVLILLMFQRMRKKEYHLLQYLL